MDNPPGYGKADNAPGYGKADKHIEVANGIRCDTEDAMHKP
jgi:hypothetical protein